MPTGRSLRMLAYGDGVEEKSGAVFFDSSLSSRSALVNDDDVR